MCKVVMLFFEGTFPPKQRLSYFEHVMRADSFEKLIMLGMVRGKMGRRCPGISWLNTTKDDTGMAMADLKEAVHDRGAGRVLRVRHE